MKNSIAASELKAVGIKPKSRRRRDLKKTIELTILALPALCLIILFHYVAMPGIILAFKNYNFRAGIFGSPWSGLENFKFVFSTPASLIALRNTVLYNLLFIVIGNVGTITLAVLMNELRSKTALKVYQTAIFLPHFLSWTVVAFIVYALLNHSYGAINSILTSLGANKIEWYNSPQYWPVILTYSSFWKGFGYGTLLKYAYILAIDPTYYEAAAIDGASRWQIATRITIPCISPIIIIGLLGSLGNIFNADFGLFYLVPMNSSLINRVTSVMDTYVYSALIGSADIGMGAAAGLFQSVAGFVLVILSNKLIAKHVGRQSAMY